MAHFVSSGCQAFSSFMKPSTASVNVANTLIRDFNSSGPRDKASEFRTAIQAAIDTKVGQSHESKTPEGATAKLIAELENKSNRVPNDADRQIFMSVLAEFGGSRINPQASSAAGAVIPPGMPPESVFRMPPPVEPTPKNPTEPLLEVTSECETGSDNIRLRGQLAYALISFAVDVLPGVSVPRNLSDASELNQKIDIFLDHNERESPEFQVLATTMRQISDSEAPVAETAKVIKLILSGDFTLLESRVPLSPGTGVEELSSSALPPRPNIDLSGVFDKTKLAFGSVSGSSMSIMARALLTRSQRDLPKAILIGLTMSKETSEQMDNEGLDAVLNHLKYSVTQEDRKLPRNMKNGPSKAAIFEAIELIRSTAIHEGREMGPLNQRR
ncbi:hypothetical protein EBR57_02205 [bacterium]|nr:hypothetical protein [bacterium]